ncbi:MAG: transposase [Pseudomonadota bacterium]
MTIARGETVNEGGEGIYHCISRCVRRAFLCGNDPYTGRSFEHRKKWVQARLELLVGSFALEIFAFAIMSNHLHVVLRTRPDWAESWSDEETARRWLLVFPKRKSTNGTPPPPSPAELTSVCANGPGIEAIRRRLLSISWFMRGLNENIARRANREDGCKGRFWEGRFKCQVILDESALLTCMTYVDLNPVRAGMSTSPEASPYTSAFLRIQARQAAEMAKNVPAGTDNGLSLEQKNITARIGEWSTVDRWLCPLAKGSENLRQGPLDLTLDQYLDVLDWTGRQLREANKKSIPAELEPILDRLRVDSGRWLDTVQGYGRDFYRAAGREKLMRDAAGDLGRRWLRGLTASRRAFS